MRKIDLGTAALVVNDLGVLVGLNIGTGWHAIGEEWAEPLAECVRPSLGIRDVITLEQAFEALGA